MKLNSESTEGAQSETLGLIIEDLDEATNGLMQLSDALIDVLAGIDSVTKHPNSSDASVHLEVLKRFPDAQDCIVDRLARSVSDRRDEILNLIRRHESSKDTLNDDDILSEIVRNVRPVLSARSHKATTEAECSADDTSLSSSTSGICNLPISQCLHTNANQAKPKSTGIINVHCVAMRSNVRTTPSSGEMPQTHHRSNESDQKKEAFPGRPRTVCLSL